MMAKKEVSYLEIGDLLNSTHHASRDLNFRVQEVDGSLVMTVEATRLGSDKRKLTGYATVDQRAMLLLWASLDRLVRQRGLDALVETVDEHDEAVDARIAARSVSSTRRPTGRAPAAPASLSPDQMIVATEFMKRIRDPKHNNVDSIYELIDNTSKDLFGVTFSDAEKEQISQYVTTDTWVS
ncbi:hypothetical protein [Pseudomonas putida]|uniref:Uncharacterized protein n=1 Tax=Pseudomonas putida TaxID=303 RepID=A0A8I1JHV2_PSEPU|nr:hypothetical protein [Pseudomonas putida]MBI6883056.1 hypothetical protein [Pseudomonas putida]